MPANTSQNHSESKQYVQDHNTLRDALKSYKSNCSYDRGDEIRDTKSNLNPLVSDCRSPTSYDLFRKLNKMNDPYKKNPDNNELYSLICAIDKLQKKLVALDDDFQLYGNCDAKKKRDVLLKLFNKLIPAVDYRLNSVNGSNQGIIDAFKAIDNKEDQKILAQRRDIYKSVINVALCVIGMGIPILVDWIYKSRTGKNCFSFFTNSHSQNVVESTKERANELPLHTISGPVDLE